MFHLFIYQALHYLSVLAHMFFFIQMREILCKTNTTTMWCHFLLGKETTSAFITGFPLFCKENLADTERVSCLDSAGFV